MLSKVALLLIAPALYAQSVEGVVTNSATHTPIPAVTVTLAGPATYTAVTDRTGGFHFPSVQPGDYQPNIKSPNFLPSHQSRKPVHVGGAPVRVEFELQPLCRIQGRILNADGSPVARADLWILLHPHGGMMSKHVEGDGRFTVEGLNAGTYLLMARVGSGTPSPEGKAWAPTYFPNAIERSQAEPVRLRPGADLSGYDIRLRSVPVFEVRGLIRDDRGRPAPRVAIRLVEGERNAGPEQEVVSGDDGAFRFAAVRPGEWRFVASAKPEGVELKAVGQATVARHDVEGVEIRLVRPFSVQGFVDRDEPRDSKGERKVTGLFLVPVGPQHELQATAFHKQNGNLVIDNVYPGRYMILPVGVVPGYYLESVRLGEREVLGQEVELFDGSPPLRIAYKPNAPRVRGTVEGGEGAIVALVPQDEGFINDQFIRMANAGPDRRFEIGSLRPGDYYAFAFDRVDSQSLEDPSFIRGLAARAERVHVEKGESATVELKMTRWPE